MTVHTIPPAQSMKRNTPTLVPDFPATGATITAMATSALHAAAVLSDGRLCIWGWKASGVEQS